MPIEDLRQSPMITHILDALERGEDIGHFGRLTFVMTARHFLDTEELVELLTKDHDAEEQEVRAMVQQSRRGATAHRGARRSWSGRRSRISRSALTPATPILATSTTSLPSPTRSTRTSRSTKKKDKPQALRFVASLIGEGLERVDLTRR
jgi:hypothetical protein